MTNVFGLSYILLLSSYSCESLFSLLLRELTCKYISYMFNSNLLNEIFSHTDTNQVNANNYRHFKYNYLILFVNLQGENENCILAKIDSRCKNGSWMYLIDHFTSLVFFISTLVFESVKPKNLSSSFDQSLTSLDWDSTKRMKWFTHVCIIKWFKI